MDIMDGHFVPNLSMGPGFVKSVRKYTNHPLDVHIMVTDPEFYVERFAEAGADSITFHIEASKDPAKLVDRLHELGLGAGITLRPGTSVDAIFSIIPKVDLVLVMTVEPGYGGQQFMPEMLGKIKAIRGMLEPRQRLEVDGGINAQTAAMCAANGADTFVAGTEIFGAPSIEQSVLQLKKAIEQGKVY